MAAVEVESSPDIVELLAGTIERPQRRLVWLVRTATTKLIKDYYWSVLRKMLSKRLNVVVGGATTTMQEQDRQRIACTLASPPDSAVGKFKIALAAHHEISSRPQSLVTASFSFISICKSASSTSLLLVFILMPPFLN